MKINKLTDPGNLMMNFLRSTRNKEIFSSLDTFFVGFYPSPKLLRSNSSRFLELAKITYNAFEYIRVSPIKLELV